MSRPIFCIKNIFCLKPILTFFYQLKKIRKFNYSNIVKSGYMGKSLTISIISFLICSSRSLSL